MGTFEYIAPEYAMTGHLLEKSEVYSYGLRRGAIGASDGTEAGGPDTTRWAGESRSMGLPVPHQQEGPQDHHRPFTRDPGSFRRLIWNLGPLVTGQRWRFWQRFRSFTRGGTIDHGLPAKTGSAGSG